MTPATSPTATTVATVAATLPAVAATSVPTPTTAPVDWADFESRTPDGFYERGYPDAPILIRDYSDFL
jgi:hypothetical protein